MDWVGQQLHGLCLLDNLAGVHDGDLVGDFCHQSQVMGYEDHGESELVTQVIKQFNNLFLHRHVQRGGWFIGDNQLRVTG